MRHGATGSVARKMKAAGIRRQWCDLQARRRDQLSHARLVRLPLGSRLRRHARTLLILAMHLTLVLPSLLSLPREVLAAAPALPALVRRASTPRHEPAGIDAALLAAAQMPPDTPLGPLAARGAGIDIGADAMARADPIALVAGRDDVLLGGRVDDLSAADAEAMVARMNMHFADDGLVFIAPRPNTWFVRLIGIAPPQTTSLVQVHGAMHAHLPRGNKAGQWKRWLSEMQMLLHDDPRNAARERMAQAPVTGIWIADAGTAVSPSSADTVQWFAAAGRDGDVVRGLAPRGPSSVPVPPSNFAQMPSSTNSIVVMPALQNAQDLAAAGTAWITPALAALDQRTLTTVTVIADNGRGAFVWDPRPLAWWSRWRESSRATSFVPPIAPTST